MHWNNLCAISTIRVPKTIFIRHLRLFFWNFNSLHLSYAMSYLGLYKLMSQMYSFRNIKCLSLTRNEQRDIAKKYLTSLETRLVLFSREKSPSLFSWDALFLGKIEFCSALVVNKPETWFPVFRCFKILNVTYNMQFKVSVWLLQ